MVYVHTGSDDADDSFVVRVADDQGNRAEPVTVSVAIAGLLGGIDLAELSVADGFIIQGDATDEGYAGISVSGAGDVNGDGYADLIVGAFRGDDGGDNAGEAYVVFGRASGFGSTMDGRRVVDLSSLTPEDGFIIQGDEADDNAGISVSGAGDVNGDGYADLIIGASNGDDGGDNAGEAYVVFGKASGFGNNVRITLEDDTTVVRRVVDLTNLAAGDGFIIQGDMPNDRAGSVSGAGDVDGDGFADLIVGANGGDDGGDGAGEAYVVFGKASGFGIADSAGRRFLDLTSLADGDGFIIQGDAERDFAGVSVSGAGDVNGDGFADLIVGASSADVNTPNPDDDDKADAGEAYVVFGKQDGFGNADSTGRRFIDLESLGAGDGFIIQGDAPNDRAGSSVSAAGDVNGDGFADLIVGARGASATTSDGNIRASVGEAYVLFGGPAGLTTETLAGNDVLSDDDDDGVVLAGPGDDVLNIDGFTDTDLLRFDGGSGTDTLRLSGADLSLDLSTLPDTRLLSIERIDLSGSGDNSLTLSRLDLLNLSEVRTDGRAELRVDGNAGDRVATADSGWTPRGREQIDEVFYNVYDHGNARLLVNAAIDISGIRLSVDLGALIPEAGFVIRGDMANDQAGQSVSAAGDVNGDGYADVIVGAHYGEDGGRLAGEAYVLFGGVLDVFGEASGAGDIDLSNLDAEAGFVIQGDRGPDRAGRSVSAAGDVNGDGYADVIVGAPYGSDGGGYAGEAYVVFGKAGGFGEAVGGRRVVDLGDLAVGDGFVIQGDAGDDRAGFSVSGGGDVNGDGYADVIVGARYGDAAGGGTSSGEAYVVFGQASGFGEAVGGRRVVDLTGLAAGDGFVIQGDVAGDQAGYGVSSAGDVNGDGYADLFVGAPNGNDGSNDAGEAYVVFGKADGFGSAMGGRRVVNLSDLGEADGFIIQGDVGEDQAGFSVSDAGDVDGDGLGDLIIGALTGDDGGADAGEAYVVFGQAGGFGSLVGSRRVVDLTGLSAAEGFIIQGDVGGDRAGGSVSGAGDVNGDGFADLLVGAYYGDDGGMDAGEAYVVFGKAGGFGSLDATDRRVVDLTDLSAGDGYTLRGDVAGDRAGFSVSAAGDIDGDGYGDLLVGANRADVTAADGTVSANAGKAYVLFGGPVGLAAEVGAVVGTAGADALNADGEAAVVLAGAGDDVLTVDGFGDSDLLRFDGGSGTDTLRLVNPDADTGLSLNLSALADARLSSIERIDLSGGADNTLSLTRLALLSLSEERADGRAELRVDGNTGDTVTAPDTGWAQGGDVMIGGTMYRAFDNGNARLLVNMDVSLAGNLMAVSMATSAALLQNCYVTQTVDVRALIDALPPEDEAQHRQRLEDELAMLGPLPAARAAIDLADPVTVAEPDAAPLDPPPLIPDDA